MLFDALFIGYKLRGAEVETNTNYTTFDPDYLDRVTVWGAVVGGYDYETQIGGSNFVPEIDAKYIGP